MPPVVLCITSYDKGQPFLHACADAGARTFLLTVEKLAQAEWPRDRLANLFLMPSLSNREHVLNAVSYLARTEPIGVVVALDEFDMELAAEIREHLRIPGRGISATRVVRDKLVMRECAARAGIPVPAFTRIAHHGELADYLEHTPGPWLVKPRSQASAIGIRKLNRAAELWPLLDQLGDAQSHHLLERFIPGHVYHADGLVLAGDVVFAECHRYAEPPFDIMHSGGLFASATLTRGGEEEGALRALLPRVVAALGLSDSVFHIEFIRAHEDGQFYFLEGAARVGGANIADMVEAATGLNLWREWARLELALAQGSEYTLPPVRREHAGVLISLARQEWPDTSGYDEPEIVWRLQRKQHAGLIVRAPAAERVQALLAGYMPRFRDDFFAALPAPERAPH